jgi:hypothetical protein
MKVARHCKAEDVNVRLYFLVSERKATGRKVCGGRRMGRMVEGGRWAPDAAKACVGFTGLLARGYAGVPKAGEEDGTGSLENATGPGGGVWPASLMAVRFH